MARTKQPSPLRREVSDTWVEDHRASQAQDGHLTANGSSVARSPLKNRQNGSTVTSSSLAAPLPTTQQGITSLLICVGGIYMSFLTWALLQERITTTPYGDALNPEVFKHSIFINTIQSAFAAITGYIYVLFSSRNKPGGPPPVFPSGNILGPLLLVSVTSSLASPFGYASLKHVGYITFILAKSCKLLPVMALHVSVFRRKYPLYKYAVVALVTAGVAIFTLQHDAGKKGKKSKALAPDASVPWGILLLSINLLFDGLTNSTQDYINERFRPFSGSQMMCAQNFISTLLTTAYLFLSPYLIGTTLGGYLGITGISPDSVVAKLFHGNPTQWQQGELAQALAFIQRHPSVGWDILGFAACGAIGQVFIFYTLSVFSSLLLVTITVTRKMLTMVLSVVWFGHSLSIGQWLGVALVFGGVGAEAAITRREKQKKEASKEKKKL